MTPPVSSLYHQREHSSLFTPDLAPDTVEALARLRPGSIAKIFLEWDQPWWPPGHVAINIGQYLENV